MPLVDTPALLLTTVDRHGAAPENPSSRRGVVSHRPPSLEPHGDGEESKARVDPCALGELDLARVGAPVGVDVGSLGALYSVGGAEVHTRCTDGAERPIITGTDQDESPGQSLGGRRRSGRPTPSKALIRMSHSCGRRRAVTSFDRRESCAVEPFRHRDGSKRSGLPHFTDGMRRSATSRRLFLTEDVEVRSDGCDVDQARYRAVDCSRVRAGGGSRPGCVS
jgi:hypothetical protein